MRRVPLFLAAALVAAFFAPAYGQECCIVNGVCRPWSVILGECKRPCECGPIPTPTPTPAPLVSCASGVFEPMPDVAPGVSANYVQGPSAILLPEAVAVVLDWGYCCLIPTEPDGGERVGYLRLPFGGGAPRYEAWINTHDMPATAFAWALAAGGFSYGVNHPHEAAYPTIYRDGLGWVILYSATAWPVDGELIHLGSIRVTAPDGFAVGGMHPSAWVDGRHAWNASVVEWRGARYIYTNDLTRPPDHRTIRQRIINEQTLGAGELVYIPGDPFGVTDVAVGSDGLVYALTGQDRSTPISLWRSADGLSFAYVRDFQRPGEDTFDGGFLRWPDGTLVEPMVVFGNSVPSDSELFERWRLAWWADPGATLPQSLTGCSERPIRRRLPLQPTPRPEPTPDQP